MMDSRLSLTASPHLKAPDSTPTIMWSVVWSLAPVVGAAVYFFGPSAVLVLGAAVLGALLTERAIGHPGSLGDGSATITGLLLGLTLPPGLPIWMAFVGGIVAIGLGKIIFGGLGQNVFNPALLGRAFLQAAFPGALTTWPKVGGPWMALRGDNLAWPLMTPDAPDVITAATPLGLMKFDLVPTEIMDLLIGTTSGSLGETSALLILLGGGYLALKNYLNWRIPVGIFATVAALGTLLYAIDPARYPSPMFHLLSGGLMLGAIYMATDMVTSPVTHRGCWIFAFGIGLLVVLIRTWGGLPEGVMYGILLMNSLVPFINQATQPRVFGTGRLEEPVP
ncbi:MAG: RnfABCDGE type electron transport complex subunit D [Longimicrobiales bacterium]